MRRVTSDCEVRTPNQVVTSPELFSRIATARAIFDATVRFHHPAHADEWKDADLSARVDATLALLLRGLRTA